MCVISKLRQTSRHTWQCRALIKEEREADELKFGEEKELSHRTRSQIMGIVRSRSSRRSLMASRRKTLKRNRDRSFWDPCCSQTLQRAIIFQLLLHASFEVRKQFSENWGLLAHALEHGRSLSHLLLAVVLIKLLFFTQILTSCWLKSEDAQNDNLLDLRLPSQFNRGRIEDKATLWSHSLGAQNNWR